MALKRESFEQGTAAPISAQINGQSVMGKPKKFSTGSLGWNLCGKVLVEVDGEMHQVQITGNAVITKSK